MQPRISWTLLWILDFEHSLKDFAAKIVLILINTAKPLQSIYSGFSHFLQCWRYNFSISHFAHTVRGHTIHTILLWSPSYSLRRYNLLVKPREIHTTSLPFHFYTQSGPNLEQATRLGVAPWPDLKEDINQKSLFKGPGLPPPNLTRHLSLILVSQSFLSIQVQTPFVWRGIPFHIQPRG